MSTPFTKENIKQLTFLPQAVKESLLQLNAAIDLGDHVSAREQLKNQPWLVIALLVGGFVCMIAPGVVAGPVLSVLGFGPLGVQAGTIAATLQSWLGPIGAKSAFAYMQSAAMGGYGTSAVYGTFQAFSSLPFLKKASDYWAWWGNTSKANI